ncbi:MAG: ABC transporter permease [Chloroflexi bacterium]|nr:ABC transporter permease [Chloroflexota bacterium]MBI3733388.1 ABC transporter permease [Chloroflexota bacterium]
MDLILDGIRQAIALILTHDPETLAITLLSLRISLTATLLSLVIGIPVGVYLALVEFPGRRLVLGLVNTGMALPPVVVGLWVSIFLWRNGPLGDWHLLYTPTAIVIAQFIIAVPVVVGLTTIAIQQLNPKLRLQLLALGASRWQILWLLLREARLPLLAAIMAAFGSIISEVGASMIVGGNLQGSTRVLTTATVTEASKGNYGLALALGLILLALVYVVNLALTTIQQGEKKR